MGGQQSSESMASTQSISNQINNISNQSCINSCTTEVDDVNMVIEDSTIEGNVNVTSVCDILGATCMLKASMSNDVHNQQKNKQQGTELQENDPFNVFGSLFGMSSSISESNKQSTSNRVSNIMNSTCQENSNSSTQDVNIEIIGSKVGGDVNVSSDGSISKTQCTLENVARNTLANDQSNTQKATIAQGSPLLFAIIAVVIVVVVIMIGVVILGVGGLGAVGVGGLAYEEFTKSPSPSQQPRPSAPPPYKPRPSAPPQRGYRAPYGPYR